METGRTPFPSDGLGAPLVGSPANRGAAPPTAPSSIDNRRSETYYETKGTIFGALIEAIDLGQLARLDADSAREEIRDIVNEISRSKAS
jgi:pilus assembly protein CpaF